MAAKMSYGGGLFCLRMHPNSTNFFIENPGMFSGLLLSAL